MEFWGGDENQTYVTGLLMRAWFMFIDIFDKPMPELIPQNLEREKGIEPSLPAWKAGVLPLNYSRIKYNYYIQLVPTFIRFINKKLGYRSYHELLHNVLTGENRSSTIELRP